MKIDETVGMRLLQGDCLELMKSIPDKSIDMILCDLPYGTTHCKWDSTIPMEPLWVGYKRIIKDNGIIALFSQQPFTTDLIQSCRKLFRYEIVWQKTMPTGFLNAKKMPLRCHENICIFYKRLPTYNPIKWTVERKGIGRIRKNSGKAEQYGEFRKTDWKWVETGERYPTDIVKFSNWNGVSYGKSISTIPHPTSKPVPLLEYLIKTYTNEGDTVLDNCMGSGSTGCACVHLNRNFIGMELDEHYFQIAEERIYKEMEKNDSSKDSEQQQ